MGRSKGNGCVFKRNGWFYISFTEKGKRKDISLKTKDEKVANKKVKELLAVKEITQNKTLLESLLGFWNVKTSPIEKEKYKIPLKNAYQLYLRHPNRPDSGKGTLSNYERIWNKFRIQLPESLEFLEEIPEEYAVEYASTMSEFSASTFNYHIGFLRLMYKTLLPRRENPFALIKRKKVYSVKHQALSDSELEKLLSFTDGELKTLFAVGAYAGLRLIDALNLTYEQIKDDCIILRPLKTYKYGMSVLIPLHPAIKSRIASAENKNGYIMPELVKLANDNLAKKIKAVFVQAGFKTLEERKDGKRQACLYGFHSLRHTFVSRMANSGVPLSIIGKMTGHSSERMTSHYHAASTDALKKAIATI